MTPTIEIRPDGSLAIKQGAVIVCEIASQDAFLLAAAIINTNAAALAAAAKQPAAPSLSLAK